MSGSVSALLLLASASAAAGICICCCWLLMMLLADDDAGWLSCGRAVFFCDLHGHSRKTDGFMYGCNTEQGREKVRTKLSWR